MVGSKLSPRALAALAPPIAALVLALPARADETLCLDGPSESVWVESVASGEEVRLVDGRRLRLSGVEVPRSLAARADPRAARAVALRAETSRRALADRAEGRELSLLDLGEDRWGRRRGHLVDTESGQWLEGDLVAEGHLRVDPTPDDAVCTRALLDREAVARAARRGLWDEEASRLRPADRTLLAVVGDVAVAVGDVTSIGRSHGRTWLNFGGDITRDFAVVMNDNDRSRFERAGIALDRLRGRRVVVRGVVLRRGDAPRMAIDDPAALEPAKR